MSKEKINIGLLGLGTVGCGVCRILENNYDNIEQKTGLPLEITKVLVKDIVKDRDVELGPGVLTTDVNDIIDNPAIDIVVEVMGGTDTATCYVKKALSNGKSVVTANKDMMALYGKGLFEAAEANFADLLFEASVGGGIPIIRPLKQCLAANRIKQLIGIINGTTNYMLTKMTAEGIPFDQVLSEAQSKGYAEADPSSDIEGYDAARKLAILASIAFNSRVTLDDVYVEGITGISTTDIAYAEKLNYIVKLLGITKETPEGIEARVHPALIPTGHPLSAVKDVFNAVFVKGDAVGETMFYGQGAGEMPTASAVTADIMDAARNISKDVPGLIGCTCYKEKPVKEMGSVESKYFLRLRVLDRPGVLASITYIFGDKEVSLASVIQNQFEDNDTEAEIVMITHKVKERNLTEALEMIRHLSSVIDVCSLIRVEEDY
ncbi:MAG: homoserine dehydrogenase [Clostridiales bacterium]|nr:homoserine dehydrogenase [Clostridiales bacterium]MCF8023236.1 homoserine dehydrogenase [Clostridiales bacterium]